MVMKMKAKLYGLDLGHKCSGMNSATPQRVHTAIQLHCGGGGPTAPDVVDTEFAGRRAHLVEAAEVVTERAAEGAASSTGAVRCAG